MGPTQIATLGYTLDRQLTLPPGLYRFHVTAGVAQVQMLITTGGKAQLFTTASLSDRLHFSADFRTHHNANGPVSGTLQIIHDGKVVGTLPLQFGVGLPIRGQVVFAELKWEQADKFLGPNMLSTFVPHLCVNQRAAATRGLKLAIQAHCTRRPDRGPTQGDPL